MSAAPARVSVIIPCYNYGRYLPSCVASVTTQADVDVEVLIIDDASSDDSADVARALAAADPRVSVEVHPVNRGHIATYNEGLAWASGAYTVLLSADDVLAPGALARAVAVFAAYPEVGLVYGRPVFVRDDDPLPAPRLRPGRHTVWDGRRWAATRCRLARIAICSPEVVVRTDLQQALGGYRPDLPHTGDNEMWLRFALAADIAYVDADHAYYRVHPASMSRSVFRATLTDAVHRKRALDVAFATERDRPLHAMAMEGLAADVLWAVCRSYDRGADDPEELDALVAFALEIHPAATRLPEYRRLRVRRRLGAKGTMLWLPDLVLHRLRQARQQFGPTWWWHLV